MLRYLVAFLLSVSMLAPAAVRAESRHEWNEEHENGAWRSYLRENRKKDKEWRKASKREQRNYWKWRDAHPGEFR
jgi:hypothetical protein